MRNAAAIPAFLLVLVVSGCAAWGGEPIRGSSTVGYQMVRHPTSGASIPHLVHYPDPAIEKTVNGELDERVHDFRCDPEEDSGPHAYFESTTKVTYAADDILSVSIHYSYDCGGVHPDNGNASMTFDLRTGKVLDFGDLFSDYRRDAEKIARALYPKQIARAERYEAVHGEESSDSCDDSFGVLHLLYTGFDYALSSKGILVETAFTHVNAACAEEVLVPFDRLLPFAKPEGLLARMAAAQHARRHSSRRNR